MSWMKRTLIPVLALAAALLVGLAAPATSSAAVPCRDRIFNDWYHDGKVASSYPTSCYRDALKHIPADARTYSSLATDIRSAMLASVRRSHGKPAPKQVGHGMTPAGQLVSVSGTGRDPSPRQVPDPVQPGATSSAPVADVSNGSSGTPLPILVLGGLALALAGAGAIGTGVRYARRRR
jgi:hypothetical protein